MTRWLLLAGVAALFILLAGLTAYTKGPWCDEAFYATPGWNLLTKGYMGTSALDPGSTSWKQVKLIGIDRRTYWAMPLEFLVETPWYAAFGFGIFPLRVLSICWGLAALAAWYGILQSITGRPETALLGMALLASDYFFVTRAADGRMDMMAAALTALAALAYLRLRERHWPAAVAAASTLAAAAFFTHPNGGVLAITGLMCLAGWLDRGRLRLRDVLLSAAPFLLGGVLWAVYIQQDPAAFRAQFFSAAAVRGQALPPWTMLRAEIGRYLVNYGFASWDRPAAHLYFVAPLAYVAAFLYCLAKRAIRSQAPAAALLSWTALYFLYMLVFEGLRTYLYLIYIVPLLTAVTAIAAVALFERRRVPVFAAALALFVFAAIPVARLARRIAADDYHQSYLPAMRYLEQHRGPSDVTIGSAELGFELGFDDRLVDDVLLGFRSRRRPEFLVIDETRYRDNLGEFETAEPAVFHYATQLLAEKYRLVYRHRNYAIYRRLGQADSSAAMRLRSIDTERSSRADCSMTRQPTVARAPS